MGEPDPDAVDYYSRIGASPDADHETIERRRKQADRRFSPMSSSPQADEKRHMQINAASNVLEDPAERERYDLCYSRFGRINGTAVYETLSESVLDAVLDDETLAAHLDGFVQILGPVAGARAFEAYHRELDPPLPEDIEAADLPNGYAVEDAGFGIAAWSFQEAGSPCAFSLWLTGGRDLWRSALQDPDDVSAMVEDLRDRQADQPVTIPSTEDEAEETPTTRIGGHPSSAASPEDLPSRYQRGEDTDSGFERPDIGGWLSAPARRLRRTAAYVAETTLWGIGSVGAVSLTGAASVLVAAVVFVPLLAVALVAQSALPSLDSAAQSALGVPLASADAPLVTASLPHYATLAVLAAVAGGLTVRGVVPRVHARKRRGLPRDAWLVFLLALSALAGALFVGIRQEALPRPLAVSVTGLLTAAIFQAALDVGAPRVLSALCRSVAAIAFGLASAVAGVVVAGVALDALAPDIGMTYTEIVTGLPLVDASLLSIENAELVVAAFGALAFVPLALTTLYSLTYAVESVALRIRSRAYS